MSIDDEFPPVPEPVVQVPPTLKRAPKTPTPEHLKTKEWKAARRRNTAAAALYREKERNKRVLRLSKLEEVRKRNEALRLEVGKLMQEYKTLKAKLEKLPFLYT